VPETETIDCGGPAALVKLKVAGVALSHRCRNNVAAHVLFAAGTGVMAIPALFVLTVIEFEPRMSRWLRSTEL
jgi:hypothetical protein